MKRHLILLVTVVILSFSACGDKEEVKKDTENPTVSFLSPSATAEKLWNNIEISVDAKDGEGVSKVEFYIDGTLLETVNASPYTMTLNSRTYEDGKYAVKAVAFDNEGNEGEATKEIEIFNKLLVVDMPLSYESDLQDWWIFISSNNGEILETQQLVPGQVAIFERPSDFNDESFNVTRFLSIKGFAINSNVLYTYSSVSPRHWFFPSPNEAQEFEDIVVNLSGITTEQFESAYVNYSAHSDYNSDLHQLKISEQTKNPLSVYFKFQNMHALLKNLEAGNSYDFDITSFKTPDDIPISLPENDNFYVGINGKVGGNYIGLEGISGQGTTANLSFVQSFFTEYRSYMTLGKGETTYTYYITGELPMSYNLPTYEINVENNSINDFIVSSTGDFDILRGRWYYNEGSYLDKNLKALIWEAYRPAGEKSTLILPALPQEIKDTYGLDESKAEYQQTILLNPSDTDSYNQYLDNLYAKEANNNSPDYVEVREKL